MTNTNPTPIPTLPDLMSRREVAAYFAVNVKTVSRWEKQGLIKADRVTLGGHHRYFRESVMALAGKKWTKVEKVEKVEKPEDEVIG